MKKTNLLLAASISALLAGCGGGSNSTNTEDSDSSITGVVIPENIEIIKESSTSSLSVATANYAAFDSAGTDYTDDAENVKIRTYLGGWQEPITDASGFSCLISATGIANNPNSEHLSRIEHSKCFPEDGIRAGVDLWGGATMESSRANNDSDQFAKMYYEIDRGAGNDPMRAIANIKAVSSPTSTNPWGEWEIQYEVKKPESLISSNYDKGVHSFTKSGDNIMFKSIHEFKHSDDPFEDDATGIEWANGTLNADKSGGKLQIYEYYNSDDPDVNYTVDQTFKFDFNSTNLNVALVGDNDDYCYSLTDYDKYVYSYNLYKDNGDVVDIINTSQEFVYGDDKDKILLAGKYKTGYWIWTPDGDHPTTVYLKSDTSISKTITYDESGRPSIDYSFNTPIEFAYDLAANSSISSNGADLQYFGKGRLYGIQWENSYKPTINIADGTQLTDTNGTTYHVRRMEVVKKPKYLGFSHAQCSTLDASSVNFEKPTLTNDALTIDWSSKPEVGNTVKVVHGVNQ